MAEIGTTEFKFTANTKPAEDSLSTFEDKVTGTAKKLGVALAAYVVGGALIGALEKAIDAAIESEKAINQLNFAMQSGGTYTEQASRSFQDYALELQNTTGVSDDLIISSASLLVSIGKLSGEGLDVATKSALDLAAGLQIDVGSAFDIVTKATQGNVMALAKWGLNVSASATDAQKYAAAIQFINNQFGGQAESQMFTFAGAMLKIKNAVGDFFENVGKILTQSPQLIGFFRAIAGEIEKVNAKIAQTNGNNGIGSVINATLAFGYAIATVFERIHSLFMAISGAFNYVIYGVFGPLVQAAGAVAEAFGGLFKTFGTDKVTQLGEAITKTGQEMTAFAYGSATVAGQEVQNIFKGLTEATGESTAAIITFQETYTKEMEKVNAAGKKTAEVHKVTVKDVETTVFKIGGIITSVFSSAMSTMAKNLAAGKGAFHDFGRVILSLLGDLAIQMGTMIMAAGLASLSLKMLDPTGMLAAGAGLIAVGSLLKAFFGGSSESNVATANATATNGGGSQSIGTELASKEERNVPQTGVQVIVQGNILNNRESALEIASMLNDAFDTNGTFIRATA